MKLVFKEQHLSITEFSDLLIEDFAVLTGLNGSGKTHLLDAIKHGKIAIEGIDKSEIVYYNYNDFTVITGLKSQNPIYNNRNSLWHQNANDSLQRIVQLRQLTLHELANSRNKLAQALINTTHNYQMSFNEFCQQKDVDAFNKMKGIEITLSTLDRYRQVFSSNFFNFIQYYFRVNKTIADIDLDEIESFFEKVRNDTEERLKTINRDYYSYIKTLTSNKDINEISIADFESPDFFLEDILNEEINYQIIKANNLLKKVYKDEYGEDSEFLNKNEFIGKYGLSPVESINEVLNNYDCNGYLLHVDRINSNIGVSREHISVSITLKQQQFGYSTTFDQLSSGEKTLIALSLLIYKSKRKKILPRVLLLDEIDSSLHPSMIHRLLKVIQETFVEKQGLKIIMVTHSPTTIALSPEESIYIVDKTSNEKIQKQEKVRAIQILTEGFATLNIKDSNLSIHYSVSKTKLPVLFTEGITDKMIIETAWSKLYGTDMPFFVQDCFDATFLANLFKRGFNNPDGIFYANEVGLYMALFDFDSTGYDSWNSLSKLLPINRENDPHNCLVKCEESNTAFALLLPVPNNNEIKKQVICSEGGTFKNKSVLTIEHLFAECTELRKYFKKEATIGGGEVVRFVGDKRGFAQAIFQLETSNFKAFETLFNCIVTIIQSKKALAN